MTFCIITSTANWITIITNDDCNSKHPVDMKSCFLSLVNAVNNYDFTLVI